MKDSNFMSDCIGQSQLKKQLGIYAKGFRHTSILPATLLTAAKGNGKTHFARSLSKELVDKNGDDRPFIEVNASGIKSLESFVDTWYRRMVDEKACLFIDECHLLHKKIQSHLLTACEVTKSPVRHVVVERKKGGDMTLEYDWREHCIMFATTDHQRMLGPLLDRLNHVVIGRYTIEELWQILNVNLPSNIKINKAAKEAVCGVLRGHPRDAVKKANEIVHYVTAMGINTITPEVWVEFCDTMGIFELGLNEIEMQIVEILGANGEKSLTELAACTGLERSVIQNQYEDILKYQHLIEVGQKRRLSVKGEEFYRKQLAKA